MSREIRLAERLDGMTDGFVCSNGGKREAFRLRRSILLLLVTCLALGISLAIIMSPSVVSACGCTKRLSVEAQLTDSEAVFVGRVVEVKRQRRRSLEEDPTKAALFEVSQVWKGGPESQIIVNTSIGSCGIRFEEGQQYIVYARRLSLYGGKRLLWTTRCDRTAKLAWAQEDLTVLGEGKAPTVRVNLVSELAYDAISVWSYVLGVAVVIGVIGVFTVRF